MNLTEIVALIEAIVKLIDSLKSLGVDLSGIKLGTSEPLDLLKLFGK